MTKPFKPRFSLRATVTLCVIFFLFGAVYGGLAGFYFGLAGFYFGMGYMLDAIFLVGN